MRRKTALGIVLLLAAMSMLTFGIPVKAQKTKVVIGWAHPLSGPAAPAAGMHHAYYYMIIDDYNAKGGLYVPEEGKRLPIEYIQYDDEYNPARSLTLYEKLITEDKVDLLFAPWSTAFVTGIAPLVEQYKFPVVGLTWGSDEVAERMKAGEYRYLFCTLGMPYEDANEMADLFTYINTEVAPNNPIRKIGITYRNDEHGVEHSNAIKNKLTAIGMEVPVFQSYDWLSPPADWTPIVSAMRDAGVDVAVICGYDEGAPFVHAIKAQNWNPKLIFIGPTLECSFLVYGPMGFTFGDMAGICYYNGFPASAYNTADLRAWAVEHERRIGYMPFPASAAFYSAVECLFLAVEKHGLTDRDKIRDALANEEFDTTLLGKWRFRVGQSPEIAGCGTLTQWQGKELMDVIWPLDKKSASVIYPKFEWWWAEIPDINRDGKVNIRDLYSMAKAFGTSAPPPGQARNPRWEPSCDVVKDNTINIKDIFAVAKNFGKEYKPSA